MSGLTTALSYKGELIHDMRSCWWAEEGDNIHWSDKGIIGRNNVPSGLPMFSGFRVGFV